MQLAEHTVLFSIGEIPAIGNYATGGLLGLTQDGQKLCEAIRSSDISQAQVPSSCIELVSRLATGGYLKSGSATPDPTSNQKKRAYLHVTQRCNLDCLFCYSKTSARNALPDPSTTDLKRSVDLLANWGATQLIISGGEPFLRDDLSMVLSHAQRKGIKYSTVISNGTNISAAKLKPLVDIVGEVAISFDGWKNESPAWLRGEQRFDTQKRAVDLIKDSGIQAQIIVTLHKKTISISKTIAPLATPSMFLSLSVYCLRPKMKRRPFLLALKHWLFWERRRPNQQASNLSVARGRAARASHPSALTQMVLYIPVTCFIAESF